MDLHDGVPGVVLAAEEAGQLERRQLRLDPLDLLPELADRLGVALLRELEEDLRLVDLLALALPACDRVEDTGGLAADGLCLKSKGLLDAIDTNCPSASTALSGVDVLLAGTSSFWIPLSLNISVTGSGAETAATIAAA